jgi:quinohemoprotein ethanol dehydrogenase
LMTPSYGGGHSWNPMAYSPLTGLVYIPTMEQWMVESRLPDGQYKFVLGQSTLGAGVAGYPELRKELNALAESRDKGYMLAWNPVLQKEAFRIPYPHPANGGTLVTGGNLLVEGTINKTLAVYQADSGNKLWEMPVGSVPVAGPMTFAVDGKQYIAVNAGWNSAIVHELNTPSNPFTVAPAYLVVFTLGAKGVALPAAPPSDSIQDPPSDPQPLDQIEAGAAIYSTHCAICHGQNAVGGVKDLRFLTPERHAEFFDIVLGGKLKKDGMESFEDKLSKDQVAQIHSYLIARAQEDWQPNFSRPRQKTPNPLPQR